MMRTIRFLLLGCVLFWAQCALVAHEIGHAFHDREDACLECLALPGFAAVPMRLSLRVPPRPGQTGEPAAVPPAPTFASPAPFRSRAPPFFQST